MKKISALVLIVILTAGCAALQPDKSLEVFLDLKRQNLGRSSILIFNFKEPSYAGDAGAQAAELFHSRLLKSKKFKVVGLVANSPWPRLGESEEDRILYLLDDKQSKNFDYILVGELKDFYYGGINSSRVKMKIRIINVKTRTTIFLAENARGDSGKDPHYPMNTRLTTKADSPQVLAEKIVMELIKKI
ncbi:MAG: hypothetical protein NT166_18780 [Candidatus Aminicenantes bacterium]|nr:hypothetical protein [Candidatus Aminicenantes bacterium]